MDLLRIFDRRKYFVPRIRYASVRSKPELLKDLDHFFSTRLTKDAVLFIPKATVPGNVPEIRYRLKDRKYYFDGDLVEPPSRYNQKPSFRRFTSDNLLLPHLQQVRFPRIQLLLLHQSLKN